MEFKRDCKDFPGIFSCETMTAEGYKDCEGCKFYDKVSKKILIIKLGAMGDVIRTTPLIPLIKKKYPNAQITWLVGEQSKELAKADRVLVYNLDNVLRLQKEEFDVVFSLEIDVPGSVISVNAKEKYGFYLDKDGHPSCFNDKSKFYLERVFSNFVNKKNNKTYQEMMAEIMELDYEKIESVLDFDKEYGEKFIKKNNIQNKLIGIHMGSAPRWPSKVWSRKKLIELIRKIYSETDYKVLLFAGPNEVEKQKKILEELSDLEIYSNDPKNSIKEFAGLVKNCELMIVNDSLALHVSIALKKKIIALFFCTPDWEIEGYGHVTNIISPLLSKYFFTDEYVEELMDSISVDEVFKEIVK